MGVFLGWLSLPLEVFFIIYFLQINCNASMASLNNVHKNSANLPACQESCKFSIAESIPQGMSYPDGSTTHRSTFSVWQELIEDATETIEVASYYWSLREPTGLMKVHGASEGETIFNSLLEAGTRRKLKLRLVQNQPAYSRPNTDTALLLDKEAAEVRSLNFWKLFKSGILHTKLWLVDRKSAYIGSANLDWRSLTQVKEIGIYIKDCPCLAEDIGKIFDVYWKLGDANKSPDEWSTDLITKLNLDTPLPMKIGKSNVDIYVTSSPPSICPEGRTTDLQGVENVIRRARKFIYISLMDYYPLINVYSKKPRYWGNLEKALRSAAIDFNVEIRMLISNWTNTRDYAVHFLRSLADLNGTFPETQFYVKHFIVPSTDEQKKIPYARVNHNKFVVTENSTWVGTSNWSGDYFQNTGGMSLITQGASILRDQLEEVFLRDWNSDFAKDLPQR